MNKKTTVIAAVLMAASMTAILTMNPAAVFAEGDESETNTEQAMRQENVGSGESTNFNCGENSIDGSLIDVQACGTVGADGDDGGPIFEDRTLCHRPPGNPTNERTITVGSDAAVIAHLAHGDSLGAC